MIFFEFLSLLCLKLNRDIFGFFRLYKLRYFIFKFVCEGLFIICNLGFLIDVELMV